MCYKAIFLGALIAHPQTQITSQESQLTHSNRLVDGREQWVDWMGSGLLPCASGLSRSSNRGCGK